VTLTLDRLTIWLPDVLRDNAIWDKATKDATAGAEKRALIAQSIIVRALSGLSNLRGSPEKLAWATLLIRAFHCLEGARSLLERHADVAAEILHRVASELELHQLIIRKPWTDFLQSSGPDAATELQTRAWSSVRDRLRAFCAWALESDRQFLEQRLRWRELKAIHRPTDPGSLPKSQQEAAFQQFFFGTPLIVSEQEAEADRRKAEAAIGASLQRITQWLQDDRLVPWRQRVLELKRAGTGYVPTNFGQLFDDAQTSFATTLQVLGLRHEYGIYQRGSQLIHGSTIEQFIWGARPDSDGTEKLIPRCLPNTDDAERTCESIGLVLTGVTSYLWAMRDKVLD